MHRLLGSNPTLVVAALLLVAVASLPSVVGSRGRIAVLTYVSAVIAGAVLVWHVVNGPGVLPDTFPSKVLKYASKELNVVKETNVLVIEGGSYVLNGIDSTTIANELQSLGYSVDVVRLAVSAANHFERYRMQQQLVQRLNPKRAGQHWVYLAEVQADYDRLPLAQFENNQDAVRPYHYLTPSNSWHLVRALASPGIGEPLEGAWRWPLFRHTLVNSFSVGAAERLVPEDEIELAGGNVSRRRAGRLRFRGLGRLIATSKKPQGDGIPYPWIADIRQRRLRRLWRPYLDAFGYFGLPSTNLAQLEYVRDFCGGTKLPCIAPTDKELLEQLDHKGKWRDAGHLSLQGAKIYSRWLAHEIAQLGLLKK
jgi:hypothetical protein